MKRFEKPISMLLAALILLSSLMVISAANIFAAGTITYSFSTTKAGFAQGTITLKADNGSYDLYWADNSKALAGYNKITSISVSGGQGSFAMPEYTAIPEAATKLIAVKAGSSTLTVSSAAAVYSIPANKQFDSKLLYTFGSISDPQLANDSYGDGSYPYDEDHLAKAFETLAQRKVDFTVVSGDIVNDQNGNSTYAIEYQRYQKILADSSYTAPIYEANGNHDVGTKWDKNGNYYNNNAPFIKATGLDSNKATISAGKPYFEVTEPTTGDHFIFMALEGGFYTNKGTQFSAAQLDWLEGLLKKYKDDGKNIFIIEHANVAGWGSGDKLTTPYYYDLGLVKTNSDVARFIKLMETYKECVIITGHTHLELSAQYNYSDNNGTSAVMIHNSAIGGVRRLIDGTVNRDPQKGLSEGYIVEVYEDAILFNGANMYDNGIMPQCSYIIPMGTSANDNPIVTTPTESEPAVPENDNITITLKDETGSGWMKNNAAEREIQLIDNDTNKKYIMKSSDGYKTWTVEVPRSVTDITFKRVRMSDNVDRNIWYAGERNKSVQWCVQDQIEEVTGIGYWSKSVTEPPKPVVTVPATKPATNPVVTEPMETTVATKPVVTVPATKPATNPVVTEPMETTIATKPVVTEHKETTVATKPVVTVPATKPNTNPVVTEPKETTAPVVIPTITTIPATTATSAVEPTITTDVNPTETTATAPVKDELAPVVIIEKQSNGTLLVSAYPAEGAEASEYKFAVNGVVYQDYSEKSTFRCSMPADYKYVITVSAKYTDGTEHEASVEFEVKNGEALLPEMPEAPTKPVESVPAGTTPVGSEPVASSSADATTAPATSEIPAVTITIPATSEPAVTDYMYGDSDLDGKINIKDATTIQKYAAKLIELDAVAFAKADVTGDLKVNVKDATSVQKMVAKIIDKFPVEEVSVVSVGATYTASQDLEDYYTYSSYNQYMALKKAYKTSASQSTITSCQNALYSIAGARPSESDSQITIYFTNTNNWSTVYAHIWGTAGDKAKWPGTQMTYVRNNSSGKGIYKITFDYSMYQNIIFTNNSEQTVDISLSGESGIGYYLNGKNGTNYNVTSYVYS